MSRIKPGFRLRRGQNLADLTDAGAARSALGLGGAALKPEGGWPGLNADTLDNQQGNYYADPRRYAQVGTGAVGSVNFMRYGGSSNPGELRAGSTLMYSSGNGEGVGSTSGTWRCMGHCNEQTSASQATLWLRIS